MHGCIMDGGRGGGEERRGGEELVMGEKNNHKAVGLTVLFIVTPHLSKQRSA